MTKVHKILWGTCGLAVALFPVYLYAHIIGPDPGYTGAPGDNPLACSNSTCHTGPSKSGGPINAAGGAVVATFSGGCSYTPGVPQTVTVRVTDPANTHFGFQMTARLESNLASQAGGFTAGTNQVVLCSDGSVKGSKGCAASHPVEYIEHSFFQPPASTTAYTFTWTPPATNAGNVHFYLAGNAVNNNQQADGGDHVYTNTYVLTPAQPSTPTPTVATGGVTNAASFAKDTNGHGSAVAPGSLVTIFGSNVGTGTADASTVPFGTCLGGTSVTFNGVVTPVRDVAPGGPFPFINAQLPFGTPTGSVPVVVTVNGVASDAQSIPVTASAPGFFTIPPGLGNAVLVFVDPADKVAKIAAPTSASGSIGYPTAPIPRGQAGFFYATGLGAMTPPVLDGNTGLEAPLVAHVANATPTVLIGGMSVHPDFAGQAPGYPGVNQINITIPSNAPTGGAVQVQIQSADGVTSPANVATIAIR